MTPTLKQLRYLAALGELRNFSRAAERCCVTQSTFSGGIQDLEALLGVTLFERTRRKVIPTPIGLELAARARRVLREVDGIAEAARAYASPFIGTLRLGVIPTIGPFLLPRVMPILREAFPELRLVLREDQTARLLQRLANGDLDVLILAFPYDAPDIGSHMFLDDPFWVAFPKGRDVGLGPEVAPSEIPDEELLLLEDGHCLRDHALAACQLEGRRHREEVEGTSLYTILQMVAGGMGVTLVPQIAAQSDLLNGIDLRCKPMTAEAPGRRIGLAWRRSTGRHDHFRALGKLLQGRLSGSRPATP